VAGQFRAGAISLPRTIIETLHDNFTILQQVAAKLILEQSMVKNAPIPTNYTENERLWYGLQAIEHGWSRAIWLFQNTL